MAGPLTKVAAGQGSRGARMNKAAEMKAKQGGGDKLGQQQQQTNSLGQQARVTAETGAYNPRSGRSGAGTATDPYEFPASDEEANDAAPPSTAACASITPQSTSTVIRAKTMPLHTASQQQRHAPKPLPAADKQQTGIKTFARSGKKGLGLMSAQPSSARPLSRIDEIDLYGEQAETCTLGKRSAIQQGMAGQAQPKLARLSAPSSPQQEDEDDDLLIDINAPEEKKQPLPSGQRTIEQMLLARRKLRPVQNPWLKDRAPPGMDNNGNTCYMNAVLQVLFSLPTFRDSLAALQIPSTEPDSPHIDGSTPEPQPCEAGSTHAVEKGEQQKDQAAGSDPESGPQQQSKTDPLQQNSALANDTVCKVSAGDTHQPHAPSTGVNSAGDVIVTPQAVGHMLCQGRPGLACAMYKCLRTLEDAERNNAKVLEEKKGDRVYSINPKCVQKAMKERKWRTMEQQDAHEFYTVDLERLQLEVLTAQRKVKASLAQGMPAQPLPLPSMEGASNTDTTSSVALSSVAAPAPAANQAYNNDTSLLPAGSKAGAGADGRQATPSSTEAGHEQQQPAGSRQTSGVQPTAAADGMEPTKASTAQGVASSAVKDGVNEACTDTPVGSTSSAATNVDAPSTSPPRPCLVLRETVCPGIRTFNGCMQRTFTCGDCGHETATREQFNHLSVQLPDATPEDGQLPTLVDLLGTFFQDEEIEKACEKCGAAQAHHTQRLELIRLPVVMALHLKRFAYEQQDDGTAQCVKLHSLISLPETPTTTLDLGNHCNPDSVANAFLLDHLERVAHSPEGQANAQTTASAAVNTNTAAKDGTSALHGQHTAVREQGQGPRVELQGVPMDTDAPAGVENSPSADKENCKPYASAAMGAAARGGLGALTLHRAPGRLLPSTGSSGLGCQPQGGPSGSSVDLFSPAAGLPAGWPNSCGTTTGGANMGVGGCLRDLSVSPYAAPLSGKCGMAAGQNSAAKGSTAITPVTANKLKAPGLPQSTQQDAASLPTATKKPRLEAGKPLPLLPTIPNSSFFGEATDTHYGSAVLNSQQVAGILGRDRQLASDTHGLDLIAEAAGEQCGTVDIGLDDNDENDEELQRILELSRQEAEAVGIPVDSPPPKAKQQQQVQRVDAQQQQQQQQGEQEEQRLGLQVQQEQQQQVKVKEEEMTHTLQEQGHGGQGHAVVTPGPGMGSGTGVVPTSSPTHIRHRKSRFQSPGKVPTTAITPVKPPVIVLDCSDDDEDLNLAIAASLQDVPAYSSAAGVGVGVGSLEAKAQRGAGSIKGKAQKGIGSIDAKVQRDVAVGDEATSLPTTPAGSAAKALSSGGLSRKRSRQEALPALPGLDVPAAASTQTNINNGDGFTTTLQRILAAFKPAGKQASPPCAVRAKSEPMDVSFGGNREGQGRSQEEDEPGTPIIEALPCTEPADGPMVVDLRHDSDDEQDELNRALALSREQHLQEACPDQDDDAQLQEALRQSLVGHEQLEDASTVPQQQQAEGSTGAIKTGGQVDDMCDGEPAPAEEEVVGSVSEKCDQQVTTSESDHLDQVTLLEDDEQPQGGVVSPVAAAMQPAATIQKQTMGAGISQNSTQLPGAVLQPLRPPSQAHGTVPVPTDLFDSRQDGTDSLSTKPPTTMDTCEPMLALPPPAAPAKPLLSEVAHYRLHGAVCHRGDGPNLGHYVAHVAKYMPERPPNPPTATPVTAAAVAGGHDNVPAASPSTAAPSTAQEPKQQQQQQQQQGYWQWWRYDDNVVEAKEPKDALNEMAETGYLIFLVAHPRP